jgi:hypothetical protein
MKQVLLTTAAALAMFGAQSAPMTEAHAGGGCTSGICPQTCPEYVTTSINNMQALNSPACKEVSTAQPLYAEWAVWWGGPVTASWNTASAFYTFMVDQCAKTVAGSNCAIMEDFGPQPGKPYCYVAEPAGVMSGTIFFYAHCGVLQQ